MSTTNLQANRPKVTSAKTSDCPAGHRIVAGLTFSSSQKTTTSTRHGHRNVRYDINISQQPILAPANILRLYSFNSTYYGKDYRAGAALLRARRPYLFKNALTGFGLFAFSIGVCTYLSISKSLSPGLVPTVPAPDIMPPTHPERRIP